MKPRWRKVLHDLYDNKGRTLLVVFSIAVGVFSIGVIAGTYQIISHDMSASYAANNPANIELRMTNFDDDVLTSIQNEDDVKDAEARRVFNMRVRVPGTEKWTTLDMIAFEDFEANSINLLTPVEALPFPKSASCFWKRMRSRNWRLVWAGSSSSNSQMVPPRPCRSSGSCRIPRLGQRTFSLRHSAISPWIHCHTWDSPGYSTGLMPRFPKAGMIFFISATWAQS